MEEMWDQVALRRQGFCNAAVVRGDGRRWAAVNPAVRQRWAEMSCYAGCGELGCASMRRRCGVARQ